MSTLLSKAQFKDALANARAKRHSGTHPFSIAWSNGELTREQLGKWAVQHHYYIDHIPQQFGHFFCRLPDLDARQLMLENLVGEEMLGQDGKRHPDLMVKFASACGVPVKEVMEADLDGRILPATRAMRSWIYELVAFRSLVEGAAGIMLALEGQTPTLFPSYVKACKKLGFTDDELEFFYVHMEADVEHQHHGFEITHRYANTPELQRVAIAAVGASAGQRRAMLDGIWLALKGETESCAVA
ncbi:MAG: iron-containing redox enzyme family protein [Pseudomonadota bacterium]